MRPKTSTSYTTDRNSKPSKFHKRRRVYAEPSHGHDGRKALALKQTPHALVTAKVTIEWQPPSMTAEQAEVQKGHEVYLKKL